MFLHEANEIEKCVYCGGELEIKHAGVTSDTTLECVSCKEYIKFESFLSLKVVLVSCKDLYLICDFSDVYQIANSILKSKTVEVPVFDVDFSDKEKLYKKLKSYITFG